MVRREKGNIDDNETWRNFAMSELEKGNCSRLSSYSGYFMEFDIMFARSHMDDFQPFSYWLKTQHLCLAADLYISTRCAGVSTTLKSSCVGWNWMGIRYSLEFSTWARLCWAGVMIYLVFGGGMNATRTHQLSLAVFGQDYIHSLSNTNRTELSCDSINFWHMNESANPQIEWKTSSWMFLKVLPLI